MKSMYQHRPLFASRVKGLLSVPALYINEIPVALVDDHSTVSEQIIVSTPSP